MRSDAYMGPHPRNFQNGIKLFFSPQSTQDFLAVCNLRIKACKDHVDANGEYSRKPDTVRSEITKNGAIESGVEFVGVFTLTFLGNNTLTTLSPTGTNRIGDFDFNKRFDP